MILSLPTSLPSVAAYGMLWRTEPTLGACFQFDKDRQGLPSADL